MADITNPNTQPSPGPDDPNNSNGADTHSVKRLRVGTAASDDDNDETTPLPPRRLNPTQSEPRPPEKQLNSQPLRLPRI
ncbi:MAG: hypothetical protein L6R41_003905 [Letrouitia leprolyta]|nr:MAG: hypothetical protein L6R41_003905 [Letrouitia leprolyta]